MILLWYSYTVIKIETRHPKFETVAKNNPEANTGLDE